MTEWQKEALGLLTPQLTGAKVRQSLPPELTHSQRFTDWAKEKCKGFKIAPLLQPFLTGFSRISGHDAPYFYIPKMFLKHPKVEKTKPFLYSDFTKIGKLVELPTFPLVLAHDMKRELGDFIKDGTIHLCIQVDPRNEENPTITIALMNPLAVSAFCKVVCDLGEECKSDPRTYLQKYYHLAKDSAEMNKLKEKWIYTDKIFFDQFDAVMCTLFRGHGAFRFGSPSMDRVDKELTAIHRSGAGPMRMPDKDFVSWRLEPFRRHPNLRWRAIELRAEQREDRALLLEQLQITASYNREMWEESFEDPILEPGKLFEKTEFYKTWKELPPAEDMDGRLAHLEMVTRLALLNHFLSFRQTAKREITVRIKPLENEYGTPSFIDVFKYAVHETTSLDIDEECVLSGLPKTKEFLSCLLKCVYDWETYTFRYIKLCNETGVLTPVKLRWMQTEKLLRPDQFIAIVCALLRAAPEPTNRAINPEQMYGLVSEFISRESESTAAAAVMTDFDTLSKRFKKDGADEAYYKNHRNLNVVKIKEMRDQGEDAFYVKLYEELNKKPLSYDI